MKRFLTLTLTALLALSLTACVQQQTPSAPTEQLAEQPAPVPPPPTQEELEAQQIQEILDGMTIEQQVGQLFFPRCPAEHAVEDIQTYHLGGYILFGRDFKDQAGNWLTKEQLVSTLTAYQTAAHLPLLIGVDEEGGTVVRVSANPSLRASKFKSPQKLFAKGGMDAILSDVQEKDNLLSQLGINVNLAPVADLSTNPGDFIYARTFGQDAAATSAYIAQVTAQMSADSIGSVLKHFPGYGNNVDTHTGIAIDQRPLDTFRAADFLPFSAGMEAGGGKTAVMVSHNIMSCVDDSLPASLSSPVHDLLRNELGFDGVVMTDDLAMDAVAAYAQDGAVAVMALEAGNDLIITSDYRTQIPKAIEAVNSGTLAPEKIESACRQVLEWKQDLGLLPPISPEA